MCTISRTKDVTSFVSDTQIHMKWMNITTKWNGNTPGVVFLVGSTAPFLGVAAMDNHSNEWVVTKLTPLEFDRFGLTTTVEKINTCETAEELGVTATFKLHSNHTGNLHSTVIRTFYVNKKTSEAMIK